MIDLRKNRKKDRIIMF